MNKKIFMALSLTIASLFLFAQNDEFDGTEAVTTTPAVPGPIFMAGPHGPLQ